MYMIYIHIIYIYIYTYEGGRWVWPGIREGFARAVTLPDFSQVIYTTTGINDDNDDNNNNNNDNDGNNNTNNDNLTSFNGNFNSKFSLGLPRQGNYNYEKVTSSGVLNDG